MIETPRSRPPSPSWSTGVTTPDPTLSVVLTVHNAERTLAHQVSKLLDTLADLAGQFELLIVDDGSTDQTEEIAHELARDYPQLRVARQPNQLGADAAAEIAKEKTNGEVVILHEGSSLPGAYPIKRALDRRAIRHGRMTDSEHPRSPAPVASWAPSTSREPRRESSDDEPGQIKQDLVGPPSQEKGDLDDRSPEPRTGPNASAGGSIPRIVARLMAQRSPAADPSGRSS
jgi:hypothetical protein